jgi:hypothetical protein
MTAKISHTDGLMDEASGPFRTITRSPRHLVHQKPHFSVLFSESPSTKMLAYHGAAGKGMQPAKRY